MAVRSAVSTPSKGPLSNAPADAGPEAVDQRSDALQYAQLRRLIRQKGLLDRQPGYYLLKVTFTIGLLAASISFLVTVDSLWLQLLNAAFMGFVFSQLGLVGHDAGHHQIFSSAKQNDAISLLIGFLMGLLPSWWNGKHNVRHHRSPNRIGEDGDIDVAPFSVTHSGENDHST